MEFAQTRMAEYQDVSRLSHGRDEVRILGRYRMSESYRTGSLLFPDAVVGDPRRHEVSGVEIGHSGPPLASSTFGSAGKGG